MASTVAILALLMGASIGRRDNLAILTLSAVLLLTLPRWVLLAAAIILARNWGPSLQMFGYAGPIVLTDLLLMVWIVRQTFAVLRLRRLSMPAATFWLMGFLIWAWFTTLLSGAEITPLLRMTVYAGVALLFHLDDSGKTWIYRAIAVYAAVELALSLSNLSGVDAGMTIGDPHELGMLLIAGAAVLRSDLFSMGKLRWLPFVLLVLGAFGTTRRGIWFALLVFLIAGMRSMTGLRLVSVLLVLGGIGFILFDPVTDYFQLGHTSANIRLESVARGIAQAERDPLFGIGWAGLTPQDGFTESGASGSAYNLFVDVTASVGVPGLVLLLGFLGTAIPRLAVKDRTAFSFCGAFLALSLTAMTLFAGSLTTLLFLLFVSDAGFASLPVVDDNKPNRHTHFGADLNARTS